MVYKQAWSIKIIDTFEMYQASPSLTPARPCRGFVNRSAIEVRVWQFVEGGEHGGAIQDGGSTSLPSFRSRNGGETLRAAIIHYMATSARLQ
jgi:hypothetical protein